MPSSETRDALASSPRAALPPMAPDTVGGLGVLARLRRNALTAFPPRCLHEPVVRLKLPGRALFLVNDAGAIAEMLQARAGDYERLPAARRILGPVAGRGLLTSEGEAWRRQRRAMAPAFTPRALPMMAAHIARATEAACDALAAAVSGPVDIHAFAQALSLEVASTSMFSIESSAFRGRLRAMITRYMTTFGRPAPEDFLLPAWIPTPLSLRRLAFRRRWRRLIGEVVERRRALHTEAEARDLFDLLADVHGRDEAGLLRDEVATMLVAGHETTALTLFWALYLLAQAPAWREALREEARGLDLSPDGAATSLPALKLTRAVVEETLRLYPPAFMTARQAAADTQVAGRAVPKGSMVLAPFWLLHRQPRAWRAPDLFDPGRFLADPPAPRDHFFPFGTGPHVCIGAQLAMTEAVLVLAKLNLRYDVSLAAGERPVLPVATLSTRPDHAPAFRLAALG